MATDYNKIANEYKYSKSLPWRKYLEAYTLFNIAGDVVGKSVLDLACGEGFYTRLYKLKGAAEVVGIDLSEQMIVLAKEAEKADPLGIFYFVGNALDLDLGKQFDLISASYLLNYAENESQLQTMCSVIAKHLKPGGRFVTINNNPDCKYPEMSMRKYGFERIQKGFNDGDEVIYQLYLPDESHVDLTNYHLSKKIHEKCFVTSGLTDVTWSNMQRSPDAIAIWDEAYWNDLLKCEPVTAISCIKND
jgi:ubiquinone/menaquinone biosynthesis C-methylase UbiE